MANPFDDDLPVTPALELDPQESKGVDVMPHMTGGITGFESDLFHDNETSSTNRSPENSWQFLGDLPYRRLSVYEDVNWGWTKTSDLNSTETNDRQGLSQFDGSALNADGSMLESISADELRNSSTVTKLAGCPHGGPIAALTLPKLPTLDPDPHDASKDTPRVVSQLRIMTNAGRLLASIPFPPPAVSVSVSDTSIARSYLASDVLTLGFTSRTTLLLILRDSLTLVYNLSGDLLLPPFLILPPPRHVPYQELLEATIYEGGCAVLSSTMQSAIVEVLDEHDDPGYVDAAHLGARTVSGPVSVPNVSGFGDKGCSEGFARGEVFGGARGLPLPEHFALITTFPTAEHAQAYNYTFCTLAVLPRQHTSSLHPELFLSTNDNSVVIVDAATASIVDVDCRASIPSPIMSMSFAPNGRFLACFTQTFILTVISSTFETKVLDFDTSEGSSSLPQQMKWCGEDSVVLHWKNLGVLMVGPYGDWLRFPFDNMNSNKGGNLHIVPEIDCCRVITDDTVEILQRVPPDTMSLLRIGSVDPSAMLLDAADAFEAGGSNADEAARTITRTGMLTEAIEVCTEAATRELDVAMQKRLLNAASYGMQFSYKSDEGGGDETKDDYYFEEGGGAKTIMGTKETVAANNDELNPSPPRMLPSATAHTFVAAAQKLRVLNALRNPSVGLAMTSSQYDEVTAAGIVARLVAMKRPALASSICTYVALENSIQAFARASRAAAFVSSSTPENTKLSDSQMAEVVIAMLTKEDAGSTTSDTTRNKRPSSQHTALLNRGAYAAVALAANKAGRPGVSSLLLMLETSVKEKVPALIEIGAFADAAAVAVSVWDADLLFLTLTSFEKACLQSSSDANQGRIKFIDMIIHKFTPEAMNLLQSYYRSSNNSMASPGSTIDNETTLMNLLISSQKFIEAGSHKAISSFSKDKKKNRQERIPIIKEASRVFGLGKESVFQKVATDEYCELLVDQDRLRAQYNSPLVAPESSSVTYTILSILKYAASCESPNAVKKLYQDADRLAKKYRVPEKRLWYLKVRGLSESQQWSSLRVLADSRAKSPIGFKPFAFAAIRGKQAIGEIMRYVERVTDLDERFDLFCEAKLWKRALDEANKLRDTSKIIHVRSLSNSSEIQGICDGLISQLS